MSADAVSVCSLRKSSSTHRSRFVILDLDDLPAPGMGIAAVKTQEVGSEAFPPDGDKPPCADLRRP